MRLPTKNSPISVELDDIAMRFPTDLGRVFLDEQLQFIVFKLGLEFFRRLDYVFLGGSWFVFLGGGVESNSVRLWFAGDRGGCKPAGRIASGLFLLGHGVERLGVARGEQRLPERAGLGGFPY
jgi:hypothetical protein